MGTGNRRSTRAVAGALAIVFAAGCLQHSRAAEADRDNTVVVLATELGDITLELYDRRAPISSESFLEYLDAGHYDGASFYRVVSPENDNGSPKISVIQGGVLEEEHPIAPVPHETTEDTGILHTNGVVSLARGAPGTGSGAAFFICIGDQPSLDFGGKRNSDGLGFAAFGKVIEGMDVVREIHAQEAEGATDSDYTKGQILTDPVTIRSARRVDLPRAAGAR